MNLMYDVLDQQIIDNKDRKSGKVDGVALEIRDGAPPRVAYLDVGTNALARRLSARLERFLQRLRRRVRGADTEPFHIAWSDVEHVAVSLRVKIDATEYSTYHVENWLREHVIRHIPGHAHHKAQEKP